MATKYWNSDGQLQEEYNVMLMADDDGEFCFTKRGRELFISYYRYYNDGDLPGWARGEAKYLRTENSEKLNEAGEWELERRVTDQISKEWKRYQRQVSACRS